MSDITLRDVRTFAEIEACLDLQRASLGMSEIDVTPARMFVVARHAGTPPIGAFDDRSGRLVGFVHTVLASFRGVLAHYSHLIAVEESWRDRGVGYALKLAQRDRALEAGVPLVVWTFDPLQSRNAYFNLNKLGVVVRRYEPNFYGERYQSEFDSGIGSDRVFAEWWVKSPRVASAIRGDKLRPSSSSPSVQIPSDINRLKREDERAALLWRLSTRERFVSLLSRGLVAVNLTYDARAGRSDYVFADAREVSLGSEGL